jgi:hypothetical protein
VSESLKDKCEIILSSFSEGAGELIETGQRIPAGGETHGTVVKSIVLRNHCDTKERELLITSHSKCCSN